MATPVRKFKETVDFQNYLSVYNPLGLCKFIVKGKVGPQHVADLVNMAMGWEWTLDDVLEHYRRGGTLTTVGPNAGDGALNPNKSEFVDSFAITANERLDVIAFFESLTDWEFICRDDLSDPFGNIPKHPSCP